MRRWKEVFLTLIVLCATHAFAQTTITGTNLAFRSTGTTAGSSVTLSDNGYLGTYVTLAAPGTVQFTLNARGASTPRMNLVVDDTKVGWDVGASSTNYVTSVSLPAGTHFVRTEFANDVPSVNRTLTLNSLQVTGASVSNTATDANAIAAADTYIANFRKGDARVTVNGVAPGTPVQINMKRLDFGFGGTVSGVSATDSKSMVNVTNPAPGTEQYKFQQFINKNFNIIVPSNAGKWASNESTRDVNTMSYIDTILNYAKSHGMDARMHNLIWGAQQPSWVTNSSNTGLLDQAVDTTLTQAQRDQAKADLRKEISERIAYYVNPTRANQYSELDVYNESYHTGSNNTAPNNYWNVYGASGVADIYNEVQQALNAAHSSAKIETNEYNVFQFGGNYGDFYRQHIESIQNAGGTVSGIGVQDYVDPTITGSNAYSASKVQRVLGDLSIAGVPLTITEFGLSSNLTADQANTLGPDVMEDTMRMIFGSPLGQSFLIWGWWDRTGSARPPAWLLDNTPGTGDNAVLTPMGVRWEELMNEWRTDVSSSVDPNGGISFNGYYGLYDVTINGKTYPLDLEKGVTNYTLQVPEPAHALLLSVIGVLSLKRNRR